MNLVAYLTTLRIGQFPNPDIAARRQFRAVCRSPDLYEPWREAPPTYLGKAMLGYLILTLLLSVHGFSQQTLLLQAREHLEAGKYVEASQELQQLVKATPKDPVLWRYLGLAYARLNETESAIVAFQKALAIAPKDAETCFNLGALYWSRADTNEALQLYRRGLESNPADVGANENYALLLMGAGRYREAIEPLTRVKAKKSSELPVRIALIESFAKGGMVNEADRETKELLESPIASSTEKIELAALLVKDKVPLLAEETLRNALNSSPDLAEGHALLGQVLLGLGKDRYEEAVWELGRAVQLDPNSPPYSMGLAQALLISEYYETALQFLEAVKDRFGTSPEFQFKLALAYYGLNLYPQAIAEFEKVLSQPFTRMDLVHYFLADSYLFQGNLMDAEVHYRKAMEINPTPSIYYLALGSLLRKLGPEHMAEAIQATQRARELAPSDPEPKVQLALCYERTGDLTRAEDLLEEVLRSQPEFNRAHIILARVYYRLGKKVEGDRERQAAARVVEEDALRRQKHLAISFSEGESSK